MGQFCPKLQKVGKRVESGTDRHSFSFFERGRLEVKPWGASHCPGRTGLCVEAAKYWGARLRLPGHAGLQDRPGDRWHLLYGEGWTQSSSSLWALAGQGRAF